VWACVWMCVIVLSIEKSCLIYKNDVRTKYVSSIKKSYLIEMRVWIFDVCATTLHYPICVCVFHHFNILFIKRFVLCVCVCVFFRDSDLAIFYLRGRVDSRQYQTVTFSEDVPLIFDFLVVERLRPSFFSYRSTTTFAIPITSDISVRFRTEVKEH
jgi:hypothetical protein